MENKNREKNKQQQHPEQKQQQTIISIVYTHAHVRTHPNAHALHRTHAPPQQNKHKYRKGAGATFSNERSAAKKERGGEKV